MVHRILVAIRSALRWAVDSHVGPDIFGAYSGNDRLEVEVLVHGAEGKAWVAGELCSWDQADDDTWSAMVPYRIGVAQQYLERFDQAAIRQP